MATIHKDRKGDGVDLTVTVAGRPLWRQVLTQDTTIAGVDVDLVAGQSIDVNAGPNQVPGGDAFFYRIRIMARGVPGGVPCPERPYPVS